MVEPHITTGITADHIDGFIFIKLFVEEIVVGEEEYGDGSEALIAAAGAMRSASVGPSTSSIALPR